MKPAPWSLNPCLDSRRGNVGRPVANTIDLAHGGSKFRLFPCRSRIEFGPAMKEQPLRTTVIGSYPFPGWLELATWNLDKFGEADRAELIDDAVTIAIKDQMDAGLDVI